MQVPNAVSSNPNASVAALAGSVTIFVVGIVRAAGIAIPGEVGSALTTVVAGLILWVGPPMPMRGADAPPLRPGKSQPKAAQTPQVRSIGSVEEPVA